MKHTPQTIITIPNRDTIYIYIYSIAGYFGPFRIYRAVAGENDLQFGARFGSAAADLGSLAPGILCDLGTH